MKIDVERYVSPFAKFAECANVPCRDKTIEAEYAIVVINDGAIVGHKRALRLLLCVPCAELLAAEAGR